MTVLAKRILEKENIAYIKKLVEIDVVNFQRQCKNRTNMIQEGKLNPERHARSGDAQADALEKTISRGKSVVKAVLRERIGMVDERCSVFILEESSNFHTSKRTLVSVMGCVLGFMVCATVGLVVRHHGQDISNSMKEAGISKFPRLATSRKWKKTWKPVLPTLSDSEVPQSPGFRPALLSFQKIASRKNTRSVTPIPLNKDIPW
ncbi:Oidioi.mRNA.OKI2018_I69.PAR.g12960.t1.cds [Oikopleura dioica]|uniref:Oidioi.mRNA.OKI2018_I69.PAR.g12960.t1.cds n=1 Tax=Oikopleura dioica TaxID=34765 RepID=A0ABN7S6F3_OIKDI|nr:Oidioi.mRNA.OKI2018_I69.PAR.g12960.t1.cds [Oikopleura dioica]